MDILKNDERIKSIGLVENVFFSVESLLIAIPASIAINMMLTKLVGDGKIPYEFNFVMYLTVIIAVILFMGLTMLYSVNKIKEDNIIENIKSDLF